MVTNPWTDKAEVDWVRLEKTIRCGVTFLDKVRTIEIQEKRFPLPQQKEASEKFRRIGLGIMGFAEMIASLGMVYAGEECKEFTAKLFAFLRDTAYDQSIELAKKLGSFPAFDWKKHRKCPFIKRLPEELQDKMAAHGLRNVTVLSIAPTGTIAILGQTSGGLEPMFAPLYKRFSNLGGKERMEFRVYDPAITRWREATGADFPADSDAITHEALATLPPFFVFSHQIAWSDRVELQGIAQQFVDSSISSTINLPADVGEEEVANIYMQGWKLGCKGLTVYRENCRENILETIKGKSKPGEVKKSDETRKKVPWKRPTVMDAKSISFMSHENRVLIDFCTDAGNVLREVKVVMGRSGDEAHALCEAMGRCISKMLQNDIPVTEIAESMRGIKSGQTQWLRFSEEQESPYVVRSVPDALAAYMHHAYVLPAKKAAEEATAAEAAAAEAAAAEVAATKKKGKQQHKEVSAASESMRGGSCPQCEGVDEYGRK
jgi:ribonucleoside-diphosphate reductase alpha chain